MAEEKKENFFKRTATKFTRFFKDLRGEMKKVVWPSKKQIINNTGIVITFVIFSSIAIGALDFVFNFIVGLFTKIGM